MMSGWGVTPCFALTHQSSVGHNLNETKSKHLQMDFDSILPRFNAQKEAGADVLGDRTKHQPDWFALNLFVKVSTSNSLTVFH